MIQFYWELEELWWLFWVSYKFIRLSISMITLSSMVKATTISGEIFIITFGNSLQSSP